MKDYISKSSEKKPNIVKNKDQKELHPPYFDPTIPAEAINMDEDMAQNVSNTDEKNTNF